jgi:hypothetical protein
MSINSNKNYQSSPHHTFDIKLASELGSVDLAILVGHFSFWIDFNERAGKNFHDGRYWMYQTHADLLNHFPYWSDRHLRHLIATLVKKDILIRGNYNKSKMDKTCWYALSFKEKFTKDKNVTSIDKNVTWRDKNVGPIPDTKTDTKTDDDDDRTRERRKKLIKYKNPKGDEKEILESDIYLAFLKSSIPPDILTEAIQRLRSNINPITCPLSYVRKICENIVKQKEIKPLPVKKETIAINTSPAILSSDYLKKVGIYGESTKH